MKLDFFNPWKDLTKWSGRVLQYQTQKKGSNFMTYVRDKESKTNVTYGLGKDKESSVERAVANLRKIGIEGVERAISTGQMVAADYKPEEKRDIDWRDGVGHRYRAQKKIVGEHVETLDNE